MLKKKVDVICKTPVLENRIGINHNMINVELPIGEIIHLIRRGNQVYEVLPNGKRIFLTMDNVELDNSTRTIAAEYMEDASPVKDGRSIEQAIHNSGIERTPKGGNGTSWHPGGGVHLDPREKGGSADDEKKGPSLPGQSPSDPGFKPLNPVGDHGGDPTLDPEPPLGVDGGDNAPDAEHPGQGITDDPGSGKQGKKPKDGGVVPQPGDDGHTEIG